MQNLEEKIDKDPIWMKMLGGSVGAFLGVVGTRYILYRCGMNYLEIQRPVSVSVGTATAYIGIRLAGHITDGLRKKYKI